MDYKIIAVDFDGTLCNDCYPEIGAPNRILIDALHRLKKQNCQLILWTCRCGDRLTEAVEWCRQHGLEFDAVNANVPQIIEKYGSDSRKIYADIYLDDRSRCLKSGCN